MITLDFEQEGNGYVATFTVNADFGLHIKGNKIGNIAIFRKLNGTEGEDYDPVISFTSVSLLDKGFLTEGVSVDVKVICSFNPTEAGYTVAQ